MMSKPCTNCQKILDSVNFKKVYWSIGEGLFSSKKEIFEPKNTLIFS
jgi:hypothetical protein